MKKSEIDILKFKKAALELKLRVYERNIKNMGKDLKLITKELNKLG